MDFALSADHRMKIKENKKIDKYLNITRELKKAMNMEMTVIPNITGALGTVPKSLLRELEDSEIGEQSEVIQTIAFLSSFRILRRVL